VQVSIVCFDGFTDVDVFLLWDLLNRVQFPDWKVQLVGENDEHVSSTGLRIPMHARLAAVGTAKAVLFASGRGTRVKMNDATFLGALRLDERNQMIGSMCSGALLLAALGLLQGRTATTYPTAKAALERFGVEVVERSFVSHGNIATAAGCLAAQQLAGWVIERLAGREERQFVLQSIQPIGEGLRFDSDPRAFR
jgi:transcriptional regulator GlxA family with amidase domain